MSEENTTTTATAEKKIDGIDTAIIVTMVLCIATVAANRWLQMDTATLYFVEGIATTCLAGLGYKKAVA